MDEMPVDQLIPQETPPANPQNHFPLKWALISLAILVTTIGVVLGIRKVNTINTNAASAKAIKNAAQLTLKGSSVPQPPLEFGSRASYERYVASQKIPARVKNNIFVDSRLRFGSTNGTDSTDQNPVDDELKPMTITSTKIICPDNSTLAGCDYIGGDGLQKAIDEAPTGSETDARRLLLKAGSYTRQKGNNYNVHLSDGIRGLRSAIYLIGEDGGTTPKYLKLQGESSLSSILDGANSIGGNGIVITAGRLDLEKINISGFHKLNLPENKYCSDDVIDKTKPCASGIGIIVMNQTKATISDSVISNNTNGISSNDNSSIKISKNTLYDNKITAISISAMNTAKITNNLIRNNTLSITVSQDANITALSNTILGSNTGLSSHNHAVMGIQNITFVNNILWNIKKGDTNYADSGFGYFIGSDSAKQTVNVLDFRGNWSWQNDFDFGGFEKAPQWLTPDKLNRVADPMFVDPDHGDFHLKPNSPAKTAGVGGVEIGAYGNAQSPKSVKTVSVLTYLSADGTTAYVSECDGLKGTPNLADCTKPTQYSLTQIRQNGPTNQSYVGISNYVYKQDANTNVLLQSLLDKNSTKAWYRRCSFNYGDRLNYDSCNDWSEVDTSAFQVPGAKKMAGIEGFIEKKGFDTVYTQSLIANDGVTSYGRSCKVNGEVVNFSSCSAWVEGSLENVAIPANITARFTEIDSWYSDNSSYYQALVSQRGDSLLVRYCPVVNSGVRWTSCESFENIPMASIPGAPSQVSGLDSFSYQIAQ